MIIILMWAANYFWVGFRHQNSIFIAATINNTAAIDTQKPIFKPRISVFPNIFIKMFVKIMIFPPLQKFSVMTDIGFFKTCCQKHIEKNTGQKVGKIAEGQRREAKHCA